jgi:hypothetical protein
LALPLTQSGGPTGVWNTPAEPDLRHGSWPMPKAINQSIISFPAHIMLADKIAALDARRAVLWSDAEGLDDAAGKLRRGDPRREELHQRVLALGDEASDLETTIVNAEVRTIADLVAKIRAVVGFELELGNEDDNCAAGILQILQADAERIAASRGRDLLPEEVLSDLFGEDEFLTKLPADTDGAAQMATQRLTDAGFSIVPTAD